MLNCFPRKHLKHVGTSFNCVWKDTTMELFFTEWFPTSLYRVVTPQELVKGENLSMDSHLRFDLTH